MMSLDNLKTILNAIKCLLTDYPKKKDITTKIPNSNPFNFYWSYHRQPRRLRGSDDGDTKNPYLLPLYKQSN